MAFVGCSNQETIIETWENGQVKESRMYTSDSGEYRLKLYHENGQLKETGLVLKREDLLKDGDWKTYYQSGAIKSHFQYTNGEKIGRWIHYYRNGHFLEISHYEAGQLNGTYQFYDSLGNILEQGEYLHNVRTNTWWSPSESSEDDGNIEKEIYSLDGSLERGVEPLADGRHKVTFFQNGVLRKVGYFKNKEPDSLWTFYDQRRQPEKGILYKDSVTLLWNNWDENGVQNVKNGNGSIMWYESRDDDTSKPPILMEYVYEDGILNSKREVSEKN